MKTFSVTFTDDADGLIEELAERFGTTKVGVLRFALSAMAFVTQEEQRGNSLASIQGERVVKQFAPPWVPLRQTG